MKKAISFVFKNSDDTPVGGIMDVDEMLAALLEMRRGERFVPFALEEGDGTNHNMLVIIASDSVKYIVTMDVNEDAKSED